MFNCLILLYKYSAEFFGKPNKSSAEYSVSSVFGFNPNLHSTRVGPFAKIVEFQQSRCLLTFIWVPLITILSFSPIASAKKCRTALKVYVVKLANKTRDLEAIFKISYFHSTQKPKYFICHPYGPTYLSDKI